MGWKYPYEVSEGHFQFLLHDVSFFNVRVIIYDNLKTELQPLKKLQSYLVCKVKLLENFRSMSGKFYFPCENCIEFIKNCNLSANFLTFSNYIILNTSSQLFPSNVIKFLTTRMERFCYVLYASAFNW